MLIFAIASVVGLGVLNFLLWPGPADPYALLDGVFVGVVPFLIGLVIEGIRTPDKIDISKMPSKLVAIACWLFSLVTLYQAFS